MPADVAPRSVAELVARAADAHGGREAVADGAVRLTFAELARVVRGVAAAAVAHGVEPGDRVAIWAPNSHRWVAAALGLVSAGAALVPVNTRFKAAEAAYVLRASGAKLLVVSGEFLGVDYVTALRK